ncbi:MAG: PAS domain-containing protein [Desulfobulbaceae bacterium]|nr:PAS domain-containing protein [Desulfobulbaceae bacterium]HIJ91042.1 PAS domain-containing protein [Deltaproteobacteria bacterium]
MNNTEFHHPQPVQQERPINDWNRVLKKLPLLVGALSIVTAGLVLVGWAFDITLFKTIMPDGVSIKANTALAFILAGIPLLVSTRPHSTQSLRLSSICALLCALIGLLTMGEYLFAWNPGFDQWLFSEPGHPFGFSHPGRMTPDTAVCFVLLALGLAFACSQRKTTMKFWATTIITSLTMAIALTTILSYCTETIGTFGFWSPMLMSLPVATLFIFMGTAIILVAWPEGISFWSLTGRSVMGFALWSIMISVSLAWGLHQQGHHILNSATVSARASINKDIAFRKWATSHGGVYVPPTPHTPPNPYLNVPHRDVVTSTGILLTLMNPAYILRELQHDFGEDYGFRSCMTSLMPLNPANKPDTWQIKALSSFARGNNELLEMQYVNGRPYLRLMLPLTVESGCLKCHGHQGYKLGDILGGIDSSIPLPPFLERARTNNTAMVLSHGAIWLLGILGLLLFFRREHYLDAENQRAATALRESEERFRIAAEMANDLVYEWDLEEVIHWSGRIDEMLGYDSSEFPRTLKGWTESLHPQDRDRVLAAMQTHLDGQAPFAVEYRIRGKDDTYHWWTARGTAIRTAEGTPCRWIGTVTDITEHKKAEKEKVKLESQLRQSHKMEAIGTLAGGIAHDFNNILSIIFGYNELAMVEKDPVTRHRHLEELQKGAQRAKELVAQILAFSRKAEQQKQPMQVSLIIKEALKMLRATLPTTITIKQNITSDGKVLVDATQIHQVIMNLCTNAYHTMRETGGTLTVSLKEVAIEAEDYASANLSPGNYLKLEVSDTGCGMDPKMQEKIFEPYFTTKKPGEGTGLGLAMVHGIIKSHHGHITVSSEPGKGTTFVVYLPLTELEAGALPEKVEPHKLLGKGERILLVDDEEQLRGIFSTILTKNGYQVITCADGAQAWEEFQRNPGQFDLVITDMTMPSMTGAELGKKILSLNPQIPVILCTGQSEHINREKALTMGMRDYLIKPVPTEVLLETISKALDLGSSSVDQKQGT